MYPVRGKRHIARGTNEYISSRIVPEDVGVDETVLPAGLNDINGQQLDLRTQNSWLLKLDSVSTPEMVGLHAQF